MSRFHTSFDNLGLSQLGVEGLVSPEKFKAAFMGHDGLFTMYADAVEGTFARGSTAQRRPMAGRSITECFQLLRREKLEEMTR